MIGAHALYSAIRTGKISFIKYNITKLYIDLIITFFYKQIIASYNSKW